MLKKSLAALAVVGGLTVPGVAHAVPTGSTASNVQLAWVDGKIRITWTEPAGIPNGIAMEATGQEIKGLGTTTAAGPNELVVPASALDGRRLHRQHWAAGGRGLHLSVHADRSLVL
ncbi:hypothetical protein EV643_102418 [Kribbella sp. VKM Ac-2527]|uniref:Uncharacterized protein n=1 Tax=Kribbella caucasensis TaxID=2512215 RepID=A0A4R6KRN5_9ACTN|nr:hypothetical protein [Kribbella sp. VKM Ac-2527]TDO52579.1 hypothetical protein EV643_102418 [Kribbella sp. VKM Ac-2527]